MTTSFLFFVSVMLTVIPSSVTAVPVAHLSYDYTRQHTPYFLPNYVYPDQPTDPTKSTYGSEQEISAWRDLLIFYGVLNRHPELRDKIFNESSTEQFLILAPTNKAFLEFFTQFKAIFKVGFPALDTLSFIAGFSPHLKSMFMELVETHIISGDWSDNRIVQAGELEALSGVSFDMSMFPEITVQFTGRVSHRMFKQILSTKGPVRRLCFVDTVLVPPSIHDLFPPLNDYVPFPNSMFSPEPVMNTTPYAQLNSDLAWDITTVNARQQHDSH